MPDNLIELIKKAGVVGAGGAGFPTHIKINAKADILIANAAECEPLLQVDKYALTMFSDKVLSAIEAVAKKVGAKKSVIAIKKKHEEIIRLLEQKLEKYKDIEIFLLDNFYPAGDEQILLHEVTKRVVPEGGIPLQVGAVVVNVMTLINIDNAIHNIPVMDRMITIAGEVNEPVTINVPIGMSVEEAIKIAGGPSISDFKVIIGGPMMGYIENDIRAPITKIISGIIVLPSEHKLINMKSQDMQVSLNRARSTCCQCSYCTDMCPRNLLGHNIQPHKTIRATAAGINDAGNSITTAFLCSECGLCGFYSCIHEIMPFKVNKYLKTELSGRNIKNMHKRTDITAKNEMEDRKVPTERLIHRIGLSSYIINSHYKEQEYYPSEVNIPLKQHIGNDAKPIVNIGATVKRGQMIASINDDVLGSNVHASMDGKVIGISDCILIRA